MILDYSSQITADEHFRLMWNRGYIPYSLDVVVIILFQIDEEMYTHIYTMLTIINTAKLQYTQSIKY